jgi:5-methylcytosine-specific restriction endonuclease McrA
MEKSCRGCELVLPIESFHKDSGSGDGHRPKCKVCVKAYDDTLRDARNARSREVYAADPQSKIAKTRQYHLEHPDWARERLRAHHVANAESRYARHKERLKDPVARARARDAVRRSAQRRRAQSFGDDKAVTLGPAALDRILTEYDNSCWICYRDLEFLAPHWDHVQPLSKGGQHSLENIRPACSDCNVRKSAQWPFGDSEQIAVALSSLAKAMAA